MRERRDSDSLTGMSVRFARFTGRRPVLCSARLSALEQCEDFLRARRDDSLPAQSAGPLTLIKGDSYKVILICGRTARGGAAGAQKNVPADFSAGTPIQLNKKIMKKFIIACAGTCAPAHAERRITPCASGGDAKRRAPKRRLPRADRTLTAPESSS